jgi:hypothetical protein
MFAEYNGDVGIAYESSLTNLRVYSQSQLRIEVLRDANPNFAKKWKDE